MGILICKTNDIYLTHTQMLDFIGSFYREGTKNNINERLLEKLYFKVLYGFIGNITFPYFTIKFLSFDSIIIVFQRKYQKNQELFLRILPCFKKT